MRNSPAVSRLFCSLLCLTLLFAEVRTTVGKDIEKKKTPPVQSSTQWEQVGLQDGANSPKEALRAFLKASKAGDHEAVLLMIAPPARKLLVSEMAIENSAFRLRELEFSMFGPPKFNVGMLFHCARRELANTQGLTILKTRVVNRDNVVFTVIETKRSYHGQGLRRSINQIMAVRRSNKWYIFKLFGLQSPILEGEEMFGGIDSLKIIEGRKTDPEKSNLNLNVEVKGEVVYHVPIESIYKEFVRTSQTPEVNECQLLANRLNRVLTTITNRARRGDFTSRMELNKAVKNSPSNELQIELSHKMFFAMRPVLKNLRKELHSDPQ